MTSKAQNPTGSNPSSSRNNCGIYEIKVKEILGKHWSQWFEGISLKVQEDTETGQECTLIVAPIVDQPALHGLLAKIRDLNLTLISVRKLEPKEPCDQERSQNNRIR